METVRLLVHFAKTQIHHRFVSFHLTIKNFLSRLAQWPSNVAFAHYVIEMYEIAFHTCSTVCSYDWRRLHRGASLLFYFLLTLPSVSLLYLLYLLAVRFQESAGGISQKTKTQTKKQKKTRQKQKQKKHTHRPPPGSTIR